MCLKFEMPMHFGAFEASLRGRDSPSVDRKMHLHKGCSGHLHGHGVEKERSVRDIPAVTRRAHSQDTSSSDESDLHLLGRKRQTPAICARSQSSDCHLNGAASCNSTAVAGHTVAKRSSSAVVAQRLYSSPTKATTAKLRAERAVSDSRKMTAEMKRLTDKAGLLSASMSGAAGASSSSTSNLAGARSRWASRLQDEANEADSGHFSSSDTEAAGLGGARMHFVRSMMTPTPEERKKNVIHGVSDDEFSMLELRKRQRKERRDYVHGRSPKGSPSGGPGPRRESPSPGPKRYHHPGDRGRRSSDELSSTSASPPTTPVPRSASSRPSSREGFHYGTVPGRRSTSFGTTPVSKKAVSYAFGSSVKRFPSSKKLNLELSPSLLGRENRLALHGRHRSAPLHAVRSATGYASDAECHVMQRNLSLGRTMSSDQPPSRNGGGSGGGSGGGKSARERQRDVVTKAWLQFKDDVENALLRKPNHTGMYKNLTDMMHTKMEMLNDESTTEVGRTAMHLPSARSF